MSRTMRFAAVVFINIIILTIFIIAVEFVARWMLKSNAHVESRPYEPFFEMGDFYGDVTLDELKTGREGPYAYGYVFRSGVFVNTVFNPGRSSTWRSDFLFDHVYSRYSAREVDRIMHENPKSINVFVLGGSVARGSVSSSKEKTWHAVLENDLRNAYGSNDIHVFNCAMGAFMSIQERLAFDLAVAPRKPDMVIIVNGFNDISGPLNGGAAPGDPFQIGKRYAQIYDVSILRFAREHSALLRYMYKKNVNSHLLKYKHELLENELNLKDLITQVANMYSDNMLYLIRRGEEMGCPVHVYFQPWRDFSLHQIGKKKIDPELQYGISIYRMILERMNREDRDGHFHDLTGMFNSESGVSEYSDDAHSNDAGQTMIAKKIFETISPKVWNAMKKKE